MSSNSGEDELKLVKEELKATKEKLRTTKEKLKATKEELQDTKQQVKLLEIEVFHAKENTSRVRAEYNLL